MTVQSITDLQDDLKQGHTSVEEIVLTYLDTIEQKNGEINAFTAVFDEDALIKAKKIDQKIKDGSAGPLAGTVMGIKELICEKGREATCASNILAGFESVYDATVIERLAESDAICIGRLNMDEFAMGSSNENTIYGPVHNPHNYGKVAGGSSGGSAASVAAGMCHASLGSDTGGSIRQPAALCGVVGLKPTYGRVSRHGLIAYASSFDCIGPLTRNVLDAALILRTIAGKDPRDGTTADEKVPDYTEYVTNSEQGIRIGIPEAYFSEGLDPEIDKRIMSVLRKLEKEGAQLVPLDFEYSKYAVATYYILATAEASSNLARYDGIRYGHRAEINHIKEELRAEEKEIRKQLAAAGDNERTILEQELKQMDSPLIRLYKESRSEGFGTEVKRRIMLGTYVLSSGYYDAYYTKGQKIRRLIKEEFDEAFSNVDVIVSPTSPTTAFDLGSKLNDPVQMYLNDIYTISANLAGICGINVPVGKHSDGMPIGLQFMADRFMEPKLFNAARLVERQFEA